METSDTDTQAQAQDQATDTAVDATPQTQAQVDHQAEAEKWKALARKHEGQAKANADAAKELEKIREGQKTAEQKAADKAAEIERRASKAESDAARLRVALRKGLTETQAKRLIGDDEEALERDADELLASFVTQDAEPDTAEDPKRRPTERLRSGAVPVADDPKTPEQAHQDFLSGILARPNT